MLLHIRTNFGQAIIVQDFLELLQVARWQGRSVFAFPRAGDVGTQAFARGLGATWAGGSDEPPPKLLDVAIIFATAGDPIPTALKAIKKGGRVVCAGIHMSDISSFPMTCCGRGQPLRSRW